MRSQHQIRLACLHHDVIHRHRGKIRSLVLRPPLPAIHRDPETELGAEKEHVAVHRVFFDHVRKPAHAAFLRRQRRPALPVIRRLVDVGLDVSERVPVKGGIGCAFIEAAGLDGRDPRILVEPLYVPDHIRPGLRPIARNLHVPIIGPHPDSVRLQWRRADGVDHSEA